MDNQDLILFYLNESERIEILNKFPNQKGKSEIDLLMKQSA